MREMRNIKRIKSICSVFGKRTLLLSLVAAVLLTTAVVSGIYAKYVYGGKEFGTVSAPSFYFQSDLLAAEDESGAYVLNSGTDRISFTLTNSADALRHSDHDISYSYTIKSEGVLLKSGSGTLEKGRQSIVTVELTDLEDGKTYDVEAVGTAGFAQVLRASFTVLSDDKDVYMNTAIDQSGAFVVLTVWTTALDGDVTVTVPEGLIPDNTDPKMADLTIDTRSISFSLGQYSSLSFRFFVGDWDKATPFGVTLDDGAEFYTANETTLK